MCNVDNLITSIITHDIAPREPSARRGNPILPRRLGYSSRFTAKEWQEFDKKYPDFAKEPRNVHLGLVADGFNPFGNLSQSYSMWSVVLTTYNTPSWLCMKESSFMLGLLILVPKSPGKDIDVFVRPLMDESKMLWVKGVQMRDASTNTVFTIRAALLWTINDYPARSSLSGWSGQGYKACPTCNLDKPSCRVTSKIAYVGHRRFLPSKHKFRDSLLFNGEKEKRKPPRRLTNTQILEQLENITYRVPGKHPHEGVKRKRSESELNRPNELSFSSWIIGQHLN
ncbi:hypothetical protein E3N88_09238 [Mikania micrantha]|uniref:Uncharacterized protein n=1 Tax=Mikania micrantha TaxID=192012 RepID=A0A5N6PJ69_9ASTR|nr:hypothetical protein E3N88_09238 [Mikania micrantha]